MLLEAGKFQNTFFLLFLNKNLLVEIISRLTVECKQNITVYIDILFKIGLMVEWG
jgi:hypothetical protein